MDQDVQKALDVLRRHEYREQRCFECVFFRMGYYIEGAATLECSKREAGTEETEGWHDASDLADFNKNAIGCDEYKHFEEGKDGERTV